MTANANTPENTPSDNPDHAPASKGWRAIADKFLHGQGIFTFLRSSATSQISSWTDMGLCFVFYAWVLRPLGNDPMRSFIATAIGLVVGGIVNCCINYKFTFRAEQCSLKAVAVKFFLIWAGSFILNLGGTTILNHILQQINWSEINIPFGIKVKPDGVFAFSRLSISLIVSIVWNFLMLKNFVYVSTRFDPYAIRLVNILPFIPKRHR